MKDLSDGRVQVAATTNEPSLSTSSEQTSKFHHSQSLDCRFCRADFTFGQTEKNHFQFAVVQCLRAQTRKKEKYSNQKEAETSHHFEIASYLLFPLLHFSVDWFRYCCTLFIMRTTCDLPTALMLTCCARPFYSLFFTSAFYGGRCCCRCLPKRLPAYIQIKRSTIFILWRLVAICCGH